MGNVPVDKERTNEIHRAVLEGIITKDEYFLEVEAELIAARLGWWIDIFMDHSTDADDYIQLLIDRLKKRLRNKYVS